MSVLKDVRTGVKKNKTVYTMVVVGIIIVVVIVVWNIYKSLKVGATAAGQAVGNAALAAKFGLKIDRVAFIRSEAIRLWRDGVKTYYLLPGKYYNEEMFVRGINQMQSANEVILLDQLYNEESAERLIDAINASFDENQKKRIVWRLAILTS